MNATSLAELRAAQNGRGLADEKLDQIRELLVGDAVRGLECRLQALEDRVREIDAAVKNQVATIMARIETLAAESGAERRTAFDDLARSVLDLGERIGRISRP